MTRKTDGVDGRVRIAWSMWVVAVGSALIGIVLAWRNGWPFGLDPWGFQVSVAVIVGSLARWVWWWPRAGLRTASAG